jgi:hypothetical protein
VLAMVCNGVNLLYYAADGMTRSVVIEAIGIAALFSLSFSTAKAG